VVLEECYLVYEVLSAAGAGECKYRSRGCFRDKCNMLALEFHLAAYLNCWNGTDF